MLKKILSILLSTLLIAGVLAGCASNDPGTAAPSAAPGVAAPAPGSNTEPAGEAVGAATESKIVRVAAQSISTVDPGIGTDLTSTMVYVNLYDSLVFPNTEGGIEPWLAERWDVSEDGLTYTFYLRQVPPWGRIHRQGRGVQHEPSAGDGRRFRLCI